MKNVTRLYPESMLGRSWMLHELPDGQFQWILANDKGEIIGISETYCRQLALDFLAMQFNLELISLEENRSRNLDNTNPLYLIGDEDE